VLAENKKRVGAEAYKKRKYELAAKLFGEMTLSDTLDEFLTIKAYPYITTIQKGSKL